MSLPGLSMRTWSTRMSGWASNYFKRKGFYRRRTNCVLSISNRVLHWQEYSWAAHFVLVMWSHHGSIQQYFSTLAIRVSPQRFECNDGWYNLFVRRFFSIATCLLVDAAVFLVTFLVDFVELNTKVTRRAFLTPANDIALKDWRIKHEIPLTFLRAPANSAQIVRFGRSERGLHGRLWSYGPISSKSWLIVAADSRLQ